MADSVIWETQVLPGESIPTRLTQLEKSVHTVAAMRTLASNYVGGDEDYGSMELGELIRRKVVWSQDWIDRLETTPEVREVWLMTHDLEPDMSYRETGDMVKRNLDAGKSYTYFCPAALRGARDKSDKLRHNIGADGPTRESQVAFVYLEKSQDLPVFPHENVMLFFQDDTRYGTELVFQELVLTKVPQRGRFWQEHDPNYAQILFQLLYREMKAQALPG